MRTRHKPEQVIRSKLYEPLFQQLGFAFVAQKSSSSSTEVADYLLYDPNDRKKPDAAAEAKADAKAPVRHASAKPDTAGKASGDAKPAKPKTAAKPSKPKNTSKSSGGETKPAG